MTTARPGKRRFAPLADIQGKMVAVFLLLTLLSMQIIGLGLLGRLRQFQIRADEQSLRTIAAGLAQAAHGLLGATPSWTSVFPLLDNRAQQLPGYELLLLDARRHVLWPPQAVGDVGAFNLGALGLSGVQQGGGTVCAAPASPAARVWCAQPLLDQGDKVVGYLLVSKSAVEIYRAVTEIQRILLGWTLVALTVSGVLSWVLARTLTGPIEALTRRAREMASTDFTGRMPVQSMDEVGQLAMVFNHLLRRLQHTLDEIRSEQRRAAAILDNMTDGILALDAQGRVLLCNPRAARMLGVDAGLAVGQTASALVPAELASALATAVAEGSMPPPVTVRVAAHALQAHVAPLADASTVRGSVVVLQDITAREQLELMRKEFVANVSHELRTPVTTIKLYAESLLEWGLDEPESARSKIEVIATETDRMAGLIHDLLLLSQMDHQPVLRDRRPVDIDDLCRTVVANLMERSHHKGVSLAARSGPGSAVVSGDRDRLVQVLTNLVVNAVDFTPSGGAVTVSVSTSEQGWVMVRVEDTGVGISPKDLPRIFDRFYRVDPSRNRARGGSGLGLAIAREIVEAHSGRIWAESEPGGGTHVAFVLPPDGGATG